MALGCLDQEGVAPRSHQAADRAPAIEPAAPDSAVEFGLMLIDALDAFVGETLSQRSAHTASA
jgi:hypothetical protein